MHPTRRHYDIAGSIAAAAALVFAVVSWNLAERYRQTFALKRMAAPLRYDDGVIRYLRHGHEIAVALVLLVAVAATLRLLDARRRRAGHGP